MDLKDFVAQTLTQIVAGVKESQTAVREHGAWINPHISGNPSEAGKNGFLWSSEGYVQVVQFDVALTVSEGTGTKGGIGVFAGAINLGSSGQSNASSSSVSHVKFGVPLSLPAAS